MIKIYLDWNAISQMKNGFDKELNEILLGNEKFFIPYSTSHIGDILSSFNETEIQREYIESDLEFISALTKNTCLMNTGKDIIIDFYEPKQLFDEKVEEKDLFKDLSIDGLGKIFEKDESTKQIGQIFTGLLKSIPLEDAFKDALQNPEIAEQLDKIFPGLSENLTMEGFFKSFSEMKTNLNENEGYKDLRQIIQSGTGLNRDKIFDSENPFELIENGYSKLNISQNEYTANSKNAPEWFNKISNEYLSLDIHGYQEDKVNVKKGRKETFKNTTEDAFHAAFASTCSFYITNDNKSYKKTKKIYEKLEINTRVLKPKEFVEYYNKFLNILDTNFNINFPIILIEKGEYFESEMNDAVLRTYYFPYYLFDFFNKLMVVLPNDTNEKPIILLSQNSPSQNRIYSMEIIRLVSKINNLLGEDIDKLGEVKEEEFKVDEWIGRKWKFDKITYRLQRTEGYFQFYFDI
jgi:hypothetical protein